MNIVVFSVNAFFGSGIQGLDGRKLNQEFAGETRFLNATRVPLKQGVPCMISRSAMMMGSRITG